MARPKKPLYKKIIEFLESNPGKDWTYGEIAKKINSHPLPVGMTLKQMGNNPELIKYCRRVGPKDKTRLDKIHFSWKVHGEKP